MSPGKAGKRKPRAAGGSAARGHLSRRLVAPKSDEGGRQAKADAAGPRSTLRKTPTRPLAKIRHDLRTPIHHIVGFSEMLLEEAPGKVPEGFLRDLQKIRSGGDGLLVLINQHLNEQTFPAARPDLHQLCHELRTPVNHIIGYSELLMDQCSDLGRPEYQSDLAKINAAAKTWLALMEEHLIGETDRPDARPERAGHTETE